MTRRRGRIGIGLALARTRDGREQVDGAVCFRVDGRLHAIAEERISRLKHDGSTWQALRFGMAHFGIVPGDVDHVAISTCGEPPPTLDGEFPLRTDGRLDLRDFDFSVEVVEIVSSHHFSHACEALHAARSVGRLLEPAMVFVADRVGQPGEHQSLYLYTAQGLQLIHRDSVQEGFATGIGEVYDLVTDHLGWRQSFDAGKVMALAGTVPRTEVRSPRLLAAESGAIHALLPSEPELRLAALADFCEPLPSRSRLMVAGARLAACLQAELEAAVIAGLSHWRRILRPRAIYFSGGVATNCRLLGAIQTAFPDLVVQGSLAPGDTGQGIGNLIALDFSRKGGPHFSEAPTPRSAFWPKQATTPQRCHDLRLPSLGVRFVVDESEESIGALVDDLLHGTILAMSFGPLEPGPRALGFHSFIADARRTDLRWRLNNDIKRREPFQPFGCLMSAAAAQRWFGDGRRSPFMDLAFEAPDEFRQLFPAVVHSDGTVRIQTAGPLLAGTLVGCLLDELDRRLGYAVLVNTSLNLHDSPMGFGWREIAEGLSRTQRRVAAAAPHTLE